MIVRKIRHIAGLGAIREARYLPRRGRVLVENGQTVHAGEIIAETLIGRKHVLLDARDLLSLGEDVSKVKLLCEERQRVKAGTPLLQISGIPPRVLRAPQDGRVLLADGAQVLLEVAREPINLAAGLSGQVVEVQDGWGAVIQAEGAIVEGLWGNGRFETGSLVVVIEKPADILRPEDVDVSRRGTVVVGGSCQDAEVLKTAKDSPVRGLIVSSLNPELLPLAQRMPFPIMTTDGLGRRAMNSAAFKLLTTSADRIVTVFAQPFNRALGQTPKAVIELAGMSALPELEQVQQPAPGDKVLLTLEPYPGAVGVIHQILPRRKRLPNGVRTYVAQVNLENGERVHIPLANLELLP